MQILSASPHETSEANTNCQQQASTRTYSRPQMPIEDCVCQVEKQQIANQPSSVQLDENESRSFLAKEVESGSGPRNVQRISARMV